MRSCGEEREDRTKSASGDGGAHKVTREVSATFIRYPRDDIHTVLETQRARHHVRTRRRALVCAGRMAGPR